MKTAFFLGFLALGAALLVVLPVHVSIEPATDSLPSTGPPANTALVLNNPFDLREPKAASRESSASSVASRSRFSTAFLPAADEKTTSVAKPESSEAIALPADSHDRMLHTLSRIRERNRYERLTFGSESVSDREERCRTMSIPTHRAVQVLGELAERRLWLGDTRKALEHLLAVNHLVESSQADSPVLKAAISAKLGIAWLRLAENENCVDCNNAASCLLPISADGVHRLQEGSRAAIDALAKTLAMQPDDSTSRWLLNIAAMTLGGYPETVPEAHRVDPQRFQSEEAFPRFTNVALDRGVNTVSHSGGSVVDDFDGDGDLDLVVSSWGEGDELQFFRNTGSGFVDHSQEANLAGLYGGLNMIQADYDNDGDVDLLVLRGAWFGTAGEVPNSLLANDGTGRFTDVTFEVGLATPAHPTQTAVWLDFDNDGDLDLFVDNEDTPCQLFENDSGIAFHDVAPTAGVAIAAFVKGVAGGDYDGDGFPDFYLGTGTPAYEGLMPNVMYHNDRGHRFLDVTTAGGFGHLQKGHGISFADYDNDGDQDVFAEMGGAYLGDRAANCLFENPGFGNHSVTIQLVGHRSNRSAIGARIAAEVVDGDEMRTVYHWVGSGGSFGANPLRCEIGIGKAISIQRLEISWPASGLIQVFHDVPADGFFRIDEGDDVLHSFLGST
jgi:hypothetical protein